MPERHNTYIPQCRECGEPHRGNWYEALSAELVARQLCWWCYFWLCHVERSGEPNQVRIHGELYHILPENMTLDRRHKGFGGDTYHIRFLDGRDNPCVKTTNLWTQGRIPEHFRDRLPDNAIFTDHRWQNEQTRRGPKRDVRWAETLAWIDRALAGRGERPRTERKPVDKETEAHAER